MIKKFAVGIWNKETQTYEIHERTDIHEYAKAKRDEALKNGLTAIVMIYNHD